MNDIEGNVGGGTPERTVQGKHLHPARGWPRRTHPLESYSTSTFM